MSDIRKWFLKQHDEGAASATKPVKSSAAARVPENTNPGTLRPTKAPNAEGQEHSGRRKTSKYFARESSEPTGKARPTLESKREKLQGKRKTDECEEDDDFLPSNDKRKLVHRSPAKNIKCNSGVEALMAKDKKKPDMVSPAKKLKCSSGKGNTHTLLDTDEEEEDEAIETSKGKGRGGGGRGGGRAGGRGGFMHFGERKDPPHKGEKDVPEGAPDCLQGRTFVISGTLDSLEREDAEDLIKRHGGRVTGSISKKTSYLLADEDIGGRKSTRAKELGTAFLTEDGLFEMIRASKPHKIEEKSEQKMNGKKDPSLIKRSPAKAEINRTSSAKCSPSGFPASMQQESQDRVQESLAWMEKYKPKIPNDIIGNQGLIKQLHDWLVHWNEQFLNAGQKGKRRMKSDNGMKKAVIISGTPGIGKTTSAKLVSQMLGFQVIEVNASDNRGKADTKIIRGVGGSVSNSVKELISNESLNLKVDRSKPLKAVLIMDEVDGMSAGDRGGVADLIASIRISKIPIICICNDRYNQKIKSLMNYCLPLNFRRPTKQQMAKRLLQIAHAEGLQINEVALEELADRVNGDMRMALNQLQYMSLSLSVIKYDDVRQRMITSAKDEDISPFTAVDKLFGFDGGKLRMDEKIDLSMSDPDLVPLLVQENYINYRSTSIRKDDKAKHMGLISCAAESVANGDVVNVQIRRYRQWQLSQLSSFASCIIPAALLHGQREILEQGERNFNRFSGWLGKNSTMGKNLRLLEDLHVHILASVNSRLDRQTLRVEYFSLLLMRLTHPLRVLRKDDAVQKVVELMDSYSINQDDFDTIIELSNFQGHVNPLDGIQPTVKAALTRAYKQHCKATRTADMITVPGQKRTPRKRISALFEPLISGTEEDTDALVESEDEFSSETQNPDIMVGSQQQLDLLNNKAKGIHVHLELKNTAKSTSGNPPGPKSRGLQSVERGSSTGRGKKRR